MGSGDFDRRVFITRRADIAVYLITQLPNALNIPVGQLYSENIYAPAGSICETQVETVVVGAPPGAAAGVHSLNVKVGFAAISGASNFGDVLQYSQGIWRTATSHKYPAHEAASALMGKGLMFDASQPLTLEIGNSLDVVHTGNLSYYFSVKKQVI